LTPSFAGLLLLVAVSEELPAEERGRGSGRLPLVGEVGEAEGGDVASCGDGRLTLELGSEPERNVRLWDSGDVGAGVGPGVGRGGRKGGDVIWDGGAPGVGNGLRERPLETGLVDGEL
jgi:hypothetical protein